MRCLIGQWPGRSPASTLGTPAAGPNAGKDVALSFGEAVCSCADPGRPPDVHVVDDGPHTAPLLRYWGNGNAPGDHLSLVFDQ